MYCRANRVGFARMMRFFVRADVSPNVIFGRRSRLPAVGREYGDKQIVERGGNPKRYKSGLCYPQKCFFIVVHIILCRYSVFFKSQFVFIIARSMRGAECTMNIYIK